jgi:hypothetical protein
VKALRASWPALASITVLVSLIVLGLAWVGTGSQVPDLAGIFGNRTPPARPAVPMVGTNMALYNADDQILNNASTQALLKQEKVPMIRMPFRSHTGDLDEVRALRAIQYIGAIPLVILHGPHDPTAQSDDIALIQLTRNVFGSGRVYVEFANEPDLAGFDAKSYVASWNAVVPALKAIAPGYQYVGPSTSSADIDYIAYFDKFASPQPDANTWHEYACGAHDPDATCMSTVDVWPQHVRQVEAAVKAAIGRNLPALLTEWNLDAAPDTRYADPTFMRSWMQHALQALTDAGPGGLVAALQYCAADNPNFGLINADNSLTPEGTAFFQTLAAGLVPRAQ